MTRRTPLLTLVVTAHRTEHLDEALASVAQQSTDAFDLVCCADVSSHEPVALRFSQLAPAITCQSTRIVEVEGGTAGKVRNAGFAAARTEWVSYLDGDDVLHSEAVARVLEAIEDQDADVLSTGMTRIDRQGRSAVLRGSLRYLPPRWIYTVDPDTVGHATFFNQFQAIRLSHWEKYHYYEETNGEDIDFMLHQLLMGRFRKIPEPLYGYRDTPGSFSKHEFRDGDLCTQRYRERYYADLYDCLYSSRIAGNFAPDGGD